MKALQKTRAWQLIVYSLCSALILSSFGFTGKASAQSSDIKGHWAETQLAEWQSKGLLKGYSDGSLKPNNSITRAELIALINRYFNFTEEKAVSFSDIKAGQWYYSEIAKAVQAGYVNGYSDGTIRPDKNVSRQETAVMLAKALKLDPAASTENLKNFKDASAIAGWSKDAVSSLVSKGVIGGYEDGTYRPNANLTRAEGVVLLSRSSNTQTVAYDKAGTYGPATGVETVNGNVTINVAGTTLQNTVIRGNLLLGKGIENGDVTLKNVKVEGTTTVNGGGENSIHIADSTLNKLIVNKLGGVVRIVTEGTTSIQETSVLSSAKLEEAGTGAGFIIVIFPKELPSGSAVNLTGSFTTLTVEASNIKLELLKGLIENLTINGAGNTTSLSKDASIAKLILNALVKVVGAGKVQNATVNDGAKGSSFETAPGKVDGPQSGSITSGTGGSNNGGTGGSTGNNGGSTGGGSNNGGGTDPSGPATPVVSNVAEGQTYTSGVLPNWTDAAGTTSTATLNGKAYVKGTGINVAGDYTLVVTASKNGKTASTTVKFKLDPDKRIIGYVAGWMDWSDTNTVDVAKMTHLNYAFNHIGKDHTIVPFEDKNVDQGNYHNDQNYAYLKSLKAKNPNLKILNSVGGWGADGFSQAAEKPEAREAFANSVIENVKKYNLDGVDLDWEYPTQTADGLIVASPDDKQNFTLLLQTVREKLNQLGLENNKYYEMTICSAASVGYPTWVELDKITPLVDSLNVMSFDFAGGWVPKTSHHTNLYTGRSVESTVKMFLDNNVPAGKIVIAAGFYAHKWTEVEATGTDILGQKAKGSPETPSYNQIISQYNDKTGFTRHWDDAAKAPYLYNPDTKVFLSYDDPQSLYEKAAFILNKDLGGIMFWEYSQDKTGALLGALYNGLQGKTYEVDNTVPDAPKVVNVTEGQTYTTSVLPNWTDAKGTYSSATLNGKAYMKGTGITEAGDYELVVIAAHGKSFKTSSTTVKFKVEPETKVIGYVPGWIKWSEANPVDASKLTHILYAFTRIDENEVGKVIPMDITEPNNEANYAYLQSLKAQNPDLKILNSIGGWGADGFSDAVLTQQSRHAFADNLIKHMLDNKLDGIDLDWEYPTQSADEVMKARPEDKQNFTLFVKTLREKLNQQGIKDNKHYELSIVAGAFQNYLNGVEITELAKYLDNINLMTYDFSGAWVPTTEHHTNLYGGTYSGDAAVQLYKNSGVPSNKIVLGVAFYSHKWTDVQSDDNNGLHQAAKGSSETPTYNDILKDYNEANGFIRYWDEAAKAPYLYNATTKVFLSYDDPESAAAKAQYVLDNKLGGAMFWEYSQDKSGALLDALDSTLKGNGGPSTGPAAPVVVNVAEGQTYTTGVLPNWTDAAGTTSTATLNGKAYVKGTGINVSGDYTLVVTASKDGKTASKTVKFKLDPAKRIIGYVAGWMDWSDTNTVDVAKMTHLNYAFNHIGKDHTIVPFEDKNVDQGNYHNDQNYAYLKSLKAKNPNLKILNSVGGWGADGFSQAAEKPEAREAFANSVIENVKKYNLDGVDLDWEYPTQTADGLIVASPDDKQNFTLLLQTVREKLNQLGLENNKYYEMTICSAASVGYPTWVELDKITPLVDSLNVMSFDFAGGWVPKTSHHTNLYTGRSVESTVKMFLDNNVPAGKIVIAAGFYAHKWTEVEATGTDILGQKAKGSPETPSYNQIISQYNDKTGFTRHWDDAAKAPYLYNPDTKVFLSYDDPQSLYEKAAFILNKDLGGIMFWEYSQDKTGALLGALYNGLQGKTYEVDNTVPDAPKVVNVTEGQTYTTSVLPNWTDAKGTYSSATLNGKAYMKGTGITEAGDYELVVIAAHGKSFKTSSTTVKFKVEPETKVIGYVPGWIKWSEANPVDASKLTHILYAFTRIDENEVGKVIPMDITEPNNEANYAYLQSLKAQNPDLKILNSIGGWGADGFSDAVLTQQSRHAFADNLIKHMLDNKLDGIDLDWEYPTQSADEVMKARPEDKQNFTLFVKTLREKLNQQGIKDNKHYELSIVAGAFQNYLNGVEITELAKYLDNINLMTYDFSGAWVPTTEHHTNLYGGTYSGDAAVQLYKNSGVPSNKIVLGVAFYSHKWTDVQSDDNNGLHQAAKGSSETPTYNDILKDYNEANGFIRYWDEAAKAPYLYNATTKVFLSYDDPESAAAKAQYVLDNKLGGAMFWEYSQDKSGALLDALDSTLKGNGGPSTGPAAPVVVNVAEGQTYTTGVLPNWTDAAGTTSTATLNGEAYVKGTGITDAGEYTLVVTASKDGKTASKTVKFKVEPKTKVIGYVPGWTKWSEANPVDASKLTHILYAFTRIDENEVGKVIPMDITEENNEANYAYLQSLKAQNPDLKILNSIGGWGADGFSDAVFTQQSRNTFADNLIKHMLTNKLDGIDLDWEYPTQSADGEMKARPEDKQNFTLFVKTLREKLSEQGLKDNKYYELSIVAGAFQNYLNGVEITELAKYLDNINLMTYDFNGGWVPNTDHHTNLYGGAYSGDAAVQLYLNSGVPSNKIVLGVAFYSHIWTDVQSDDNNGLHQAATGSGDTPTYNDILEKYNESTGFIRYWDDAAKAPYLYNADTKVFLSYDDPESAAAKAQYVLDNKLGGAMFWEYSQDKSGALLDALVNVIQ